MISSIRKISVLFLAVLFSAAGFSGEEVSPVSGAEKKAGPVKHFRRRPPKIFWSKLSSEERAQIDQLARSGKKDELRKRMRELFYKYRPEEMKRLDVLSDRYLKSKDEAERLSIRKEMETLSRALFRKRQDFTKNNIADRHFPGCGREAEYGKTAGTCTAGFTAFERTL